jgi:hypothetical protein
MSNLQSGDPGAAWAILGAKDVTDPSLTVTDVRRMSEGTGALVSGDRVLVTQWDSILRNFQRRARSLLPSQWTLATLAPQVSDGTTRSSDSVAINGQWDQATKEALVYLLASVGDAPSVIAPLLPTDASPTFEQAIVRALMNFAFIITRVGTPSSPFLDAAEQRAARGLRLPHNNMLLPSTKVLVTSPENAREWFAVYDPSTEEPPTPPGGAVPATTQPAPAVVTPSGAAATKVSPWLVVGGVALLGAAAYYFTRDDARGNPARSTDMLQYALKLGRLGKAPTVEELQAKGYSYSDAQFISSAAAAEQRRVYQR